MSAETVTGATYYRPRFLVRPVITISVLNGGYNSMSVLMPQCSHAPRVLVVADILLIHGFEYLLHTRGQHGV